MTVSNTTSSITLAGDGVTKTFSYNFLIPYQDNGTTPAILVQTISSTGVATTIASGLYSYTGINTSAGGTVTYPLSGSAIAAGTYLKISRALAFTQSVAVPNTTLYPNVIETIADRLVLMMQQIGVGGSTTIINATTTGYPPLLTTLGPMDGGGVNTAANDLVFAAAEASTNLRWSLPAGVYATTLIEGNLTKSYEGEGVILFPDLAVMPGHYGYISVAPTLWPTQGTTGWFRGDQRFTDGGERKIIGPGTRASTNNRYFESAYIPHHAWFDTQDGSSSVIARLTVAASTASYNITVDGINSSDVNGKDICFYTGYGGTLLDIKHVNSVAGTVLTLSTYPSANHPIGTVISIGSRTWNGFSYVRVTNTGAGDSYGDIRRMIQSYVKKPGQTHFFETSTVGQYGGDINFVGSAGGSYGTGWESSYTDQGNDVAVIAQVDTFVRTNDTGALSCVWLGTLFKSEGTKPADAAHAVAGKWRVGLDTVRADLSTFVTTSDGINAAINTALGHRWVMNSTASTAGRGGSTLYGTYFGNTPGDMFIESANDGTSDYIALRFNRASPNDARFRMRPDSFNFNKQVNGAAAIAAATGLATNTNYKVGLDGLLGNTYFIYNGTNVLLYKGGSLVASW